MQPVAVVSLYDALPSGVSGYASVELSDQQHATVSIKKMTYTVFPRTAFRKLFREKGEHKIAMVHVPLSLRRVTRAKYCTGFSVGGKKPVLVVPPMTVIGFLHCLP